MDPAKLALTGQASCVTALRQFVQSAGFGHALLLAGYDAVARDAVARWCVERIVCTAQGPESCQSCAGCRSLQQHANLALYHVTLNDRVAYAVDDVRAIRAHLALRAGQPGRRVVWIDTVERCTPAAANALLKVLEEPGVDVAFVLTTASPDRVLPTIRSRAMLYRLQPVPRRAMAEALVSSGGAEKAVAAAIQAAPGQLGQAAALVASADALAVLRTADVIAAAIAGQALATKFRTLAAYLEGDRDPALQRQAVHVLLAAFARRAGQDLWVQQRLGRLLAALQGLQTNSQPRLLLEAFIS